MTSFAIEADNGFAVIVLEEVSAVTLFERYFKKSYGTEQMEGNPRDSFWALGVVLSSGEKVYLNFYIQSQAAKIFTSITMALDKIKCVDKNKNKTNTKRKKGDFNDIT